MEDANSAVVGPFIIAYLLRACAVRGKPVMRGVRSMHCVHGMRGMRGRSGKRGHRGMAVCAASPHCAACEACTACTASAAYAACAASEASAAARAKPSLRERVLARGQSDCVGRAVPEGTHGTGAPRAWPQESPNLPICRRQALCGHPLLCQ